MTKFLTILGVLLLASGLAYAVMPSAPLQITVVPAAVPQWQVSQIYDCMTPYSIGDSFDRSDPSSGICIIPWGLSDSGKPSYTNESLIVLLKWPGAQTVSSITLQNNAATCSAIPGASSASTTANLSLAAYMCPNLVRPANVVMVKWSGSVGNNVEIGVAEVYGCTSPCIAEGGNGAITAYGPASTPVSLATSGPTTSPNDLIMSFGTPNDPTTLSSGSCCTASFNGGNNFTKGEYQIGATPQVYTNNFNASSSFSGYVGQLIFALKQNPQPPVSSPLYITQQGYSAFQTDQAGKIVGSVAATTTDRSRFVGTLAMTNNPGGLLSFNPSTGALSLVRSLTPADVGTYPGQLSATANSTTITQNISFSVIPPRTTVAGTNCPSTPPPAALRAGLTKLAYCLDGAGTRYAVATNWVDCNNTNQPGHEWYIAGFPTILCNDISQGVDPVTGQTVVILHYHSTSDWNAMQALHPGDSGILNMKMGTQNSCLGGPCVPFFYTVPSTSYVEIEARATPILGDGLGHTPSPDWWEYGTCPDLTNKNCAYPNSWSIQEYDIVEAYGPVPTGGSTTLHDWFDIGSGKQDKTGGSGSTQGIANFTHVPGWSIQDDHIYGVLRTIDGVTTKRYVQYLDDVMVNNTPKGNGVSNPFDQAVTAAQTTNGLDETSILSTRQWLTLWFGGTYGLNTTSCQNQPKCVAYGGDPDQFTYINHIAVWQSPSDPVNGIISGQVTVANGLTQ